MLGGKRFWVSKYHPTYDAFILMEKSIFKIESSGDYYLKQVIKLSTLTKGCHKFTSSQWNATWCTQHHLQNILKWPFEANTPGGGTLWSQACFCK